MPRNTIQKRFTETEGRGYIIEGGQPKAVAFILPKRVGLSTAQAIIRRENPSFSASEVVERSTLYRMTFEDFKKHAEAVEE